jgi:predicted ATPase
MSDNFSPVIRTPDQRLRVFVSSTLAELAPERAAVARAISALGFTPVMFELGARPHPPQELYRAYLAQSDIFIGLYWQRYGWIGPGMEISGLEDELQLSSSLPRLLYVKTPAPDREPRLVEMIAGLQTEATDSYRSFGSQRELGRLVRNDLAVLLSERFSAATHGSASSPARQASSRAVRRLPRSLPVTSTSLIGREHEIGEVVDLLETPEVRLVTLTGAGGIGKTRLAIAVGTRLEERSSRQTVFVSLAAITQHELVMPRVAAIVGATIEGTRAPVDALAEHFAATPALLVLDNLEQVIGAALEVDELLAACPELKILVTSRTVLRLRAEREYSVSALTVPVFARQPPIGELASLPAVQLFVDRARAVRNDFALTEANAMAVMEICRRLDGLPLAIELAAARTRLLDPEALLVRLANQLDALGPGPVDLPERQRTLRATVEWSVGLLDEAEQRFLFALSVFADGWTLAAATNVCGLEEDRVLDLLDALAAHSLVNVEASDTGSRFGMLTSVQNVAAERLAASSHGPEVEQRHALYFRSLVESADWPHERQTYWVNRLRAEEENLRIAVRWFFTHDIEPLPHLFRMLWLYWQMHDRMPEGRAWIDELRGRADTLDEHARAEVLFTSAVTAVEVGDDAAALAAVEGIKRLDPNIDDPPLQNALHLAVAWTMPIIDDLEGARESASKALTGFRQLDEPFVASAALTVGMLEMTRARYETAGRLLSEVKDLGERFGNNWLRSTARTQLATLALRTGDLEQARALLMESADSMEDSHLSTLTVTFALIALTELALVESNPRLAAVAVGAASGLRRRAGLLAWPLTRRLEADLLDRVTHELDLETFKAAFEQGSQLHLREALTLVRQHTRAATNGST